MQTNPEKKSIKHWAEDDKPREKLLLKGKEALSDAELIAILIGSGNAEDSAVELSRKILHAAEQNLVRLSQTSIQDLMQFKGIGEAKAITIAAALELGRRRQNFQQDEKPIIRSSSDAFKIMGSYMADLTHEECWVVLLSRAKKAIHKEQISVGGTSSAVVDSKKIFNAALRHLADAIILFHNHPSGNLIPSTQDNALTQQVKAAGKLIDISLLDHLIISSKGYYSYADEGNI